MKVIAVIGDIIGSKEIPRREAFQRRLATVLAAPQRARTGLASPFTITLGDEFQAVYRQPGALWADLVGILAAVHPVEVRFALGVGELDTRLNSRQALGMDGPAFHRARAAMTELKSGGGRFRIAGADAADWKLVNLVLALLGNEISGWTQNRLHILAGLLRGRPVRDLGDELEISKVAIYKNINASVLDEVAAICQEINAALVAELSDP